VLAHAVDLLLGGRARQGIVRPGASEAYVEGVFELPPGHTDERLPEDVEELVLARRVGADGRTRAYLNGRTLPVAELRELAGGLLSFYGQHEHRKLMLAAAQLEILDGFCGAAQVTRRAACASAWTGVRRAQAELERLQELGGARERELDLLLFELDEIDAVAPSLTERDELLIERERLRHADSLRGAAWTAESALSGDESSAAALLSAAAGALAGAAGLDRELDVVAARIEALALEAHDAAGDLRAYGENLPTDEERHAELEERLASITRLERKHGGTIEGVLLHAAHCRARREEIEGAEIALEAAQHELTVAEEAFASASSELRAARRDAAPGLSDDVSSRLGTLGMGDAVFAVHTEPAEPGPRGIDAVRFEIAPNPGVPAAPLRDVASGGELSRTMLALLGAANATSDATLVFDEVDAGIGGHTARAVGEQLRELAGTRQLVCITHLPQVASFAARHFRIAKDTGAEPTRATVTRLSDAEVVGELVRMLGAPAEDVAARRHAKELRKAA